MNDHERHPRPPGDGRDQPSAHEDTSEHESVGDSLLEALAKAPSAAGGPRSSLANLELPPQIAHYRVLERLGSGGMGVVFRAHDTRLDRPVALKVLPSEVIGGGEQVRRFVQEARSASALNHPNIITVYEIGQATLDPVGPTGSRPTSMHYIAMELIEGATLRAQLREGDLPLTRKLEIFVQIATGLGKAHGAGIVHRDLKPENVMVTPDGFAKILDFGLAKLVGVGDGEGAAPHTRTGMVIGTAGYMSPEQVQGTVIDARSDIFAFGSLLYEAVTGEAPFRGDSGVEKLHRVLHDEPPRLRSVRPEAPDELDRIVHKCLAKSPDERYQDISEVRADLRSLLRQLDSAALTPSSVSKAHQAIRTAAPTAPATPPRRSLPWVVAGLVAVGVVGAALWWPTASNKPPATAQAPATQMQIARLTYSAKVKHAAISPDGKVLAVVEDRGRREVLRVRQVATGSIVRVVPPAALEYRGVTVSPSGNYLYYVAGKRGGLLTSLFQVPILGGEPRRLIRDVDSRVTFSPDGKRLAFVRGLAKRDEVVLLTANADGTDLRELARVPGTNKIYLPTWSPDGKRIVCATRRLGARWMLMEFPLRGGRPRTWKGWTAFEISGLNWLPDGSGVVAAGSQDASRMHQLWIVTAGGQRQRRITHDPNSYHGVSLTRDGRTLVTIRRDELTSLWVAPEGKAAQARRVSTVHAWYRGIAWTPDGRLVYGTNQTGSWDLWIANADGSGPRRLTSDSSANALPAVSPDGKTVAFVTDRAGGLTIWRMDLDGSNVRQLTRGPFDFMPRFTPDGRWVVYDSTGTSKPHPFRIAAGGGKPQPLTSGLGLHPDPSPDGKLVAVRYWPGSVGQGWVAALLPIAGGKPVRILPLSRDAEGPLRWSPDGKALTYVAHRGGAWNLWALPVDGGKPRRLTDFPSERIFDFSWGRTSKELAIVRGLLARDAYVVRNYR